MIFAQSEITIRKLTDWDSLEDLTELLHRAYGRLAEMGLRYLATHQDVAMTRERIAESDCFVAVLHDRIIGTICFHPPSSQIGSPWMDRKDVAHVGQLAVDPDFQDRGIGLRLMQHCEEYAKRLGAKHISLDTARPALHLIAWYDRQGYAVVEEVDWEITNYVSVVMSKRLQ